MQTLSSLLSSFLETKMIGAKGPSLQIHVKKDPRNQGDTYETSWDSGVYEVKASSVGAGVYGSCCARESEVLGGLGGSLGSWKASCPHRLLWLTSPWDVSSEDILRFLEWGYNGCILSGEWKEEWTLQVEEWKAAGIQMYLHRTVGEENWGELPEGVGVFWECQLDTFVGKTREETLKDLVSEELRSLEEALKGRPLIYGLFSECGKGVQSLAYWIGELAMDAGPQTSLAFSAVEGERWKSYLGLSPIWTSLLRSVESSSTPLLPVYNVGGIRMGDGLWPALPLDVLDETSGYLGRSVSGAIGLCPSMPSPQSFLDAGLWMLGRLLWKTESCRFLLSQWLDLRFPGCEKKGVLEALFSVQHLVSELFSLYDLPCDGKAQAGKAEALRIRAEAVIAQLNALSLLHCHGLEDAGGAPELGHWILFFVRDAKRMALQFLQNHQIPMAAVLDGSDMKPSFWTDITQSPSRGLGSGAAVGLRSEPNRGDEGTLQEKIYLATRGE